MVMMGDNQYRYRILVKPHRNAEARWMLSQFYRDYTIKCPCGCRRNLLVVRCEEIKGEHWWD